MWAVDTAGLPDGERFDLVRGVLRLVRPTAALFQTDVPWGAETPWPAEVKAAAAVLAPSRRYASTGWLDAGDDRVWDAYVCLAPFVYASNVWTADGVELISLADEGTSLTVCSNAEAQASLEEVVPRSRLVPLP